MFFTKQTAIGGPIDSQLNHGFLKIKDAAKLLAVTFGGRKQLFANKSARVVG